MNAHLPIVCRHKCLDIMAKLPTPSNAPSRPTPPIKVIAVGTPQPECLTLFARLVLEELSQPTLKLVHDNQQPRDLLSPELERQE